MRLLPLCVAKTDVLNVFPTIALDLYYHLNVGAIAQDADVQPIP